MLLKKYKIHLIGALLSLLVFYCLIFSICNSIRLDNLNESLRTELKTTNKKIAELELKFDTFKTLTSKEFESTWRSFARVRSNFLAFGLGFHLEEEDIAPDSYAIAKEEKKYE